MPEIDCRNCAALCCGEGEKITLTDSELAFLKSGGSFFNQKGVPKTWRRFDFQDPKGVTGVAGTFIFSSICNFVIEKDGWLQCGVYDNPRRPQECDLFPMGGEGCKLIRDAGSVKAAIKAWEETGKSLSMQSKLQELFSKPFKWLARAH